MHAIEWLQICMVDYMRIHVHFLEMVHNVVP